jgi:signal transduction histidine kinase/CheY-like chemotaxis protein
MHVDGPDPSATAERVLVLVRGRRDGEVTCRLLARDGLTPFQCTDGSELRREIEKGASTALIGEDALTKDTFADLRVVLERQPVWSDFPIIVFSTAAEPRARLPAEIVYRLGNVIFLDRPVQIRSMLASVHSAVRSRRRQYETRRAIESRDQFLAMLGHELRNPLGAICLASEMLDGKIGPAGRHKEQDVIARQARHLTRLVDDLLDVARITHGKVVLQRERMSLVDPVRTAFELLERRAREHLAAYELVVLADPIEVEGDRQRLEQVFTNLLTNALKYTPRGGAVRVEVRREGDAPVVVVKDSGVGLARGMEERVFDAFIQVDRSLDRAQGGIGLGLALVRSIVDLHGGTVRAESDGPGRGSAFVVAFPPADDDAPPSQPFRPATVPTSTRKRVLVVDDNPDIRDLLAEFLEMEGHEVMSAADGFGALEKILGSPLDVAFVDVGLPGMDGLELARRARAQGSRVFLVAMTGYGQPEDKALTAAAGFDAHLTKPVDAADIAKALLQAEARRA